MLFRVLWVSSLSVTCIASGYDGKIISGAIGAKVSSGVVRRGALTYPSPQASPVLYLGFFDERIQFFFNSLEVLDFLGTDRLRGRMKIGLLGDDPTLRLGGAADVRSSRPTALEWTTRLEFFYPNFAAPWVQCDLMYGRDFKEYQGHYLEGTLRVTLGRFFLEKEKPLVEPQLFATAGFGDAAHNRFWYGAGTSPGFTHVEYGVMIAAPARIDRHFPVLRLYRYDLLGPQASPGGLVQQSGGFMAEATVAFGLF